MIMVAREQKRYVVMDKNANNKEKISSDRSENSRKISLKDRKTRVNN